MTVENYLPTIDENLASGVSKAEVEAWARNLIKAIDKSKKAKLENAFNTILELVRGVELPAEELIAFLNKNDALYGNANYENGNPKKLYKHPTKNLTWGGIGRRPEWFVDCLTEGFSEEELLVSSESQEKADFKVISAILSDLLKGDLGDSELQGMAKDLGNISKNYLGDTTAEEAPAPKPTKKTALKTKPTTRKKSTTTA